MKKHRLLSRTSELFAGDPDLHEFMKPSADVSSLVASQLRKSSPKADRKSLCDVLFVHKENKCRVKSTDETLFSQDSSFSTLVRALITTLIPVNGDLKLRNT